ncbi:DsbA family protein [Actinoplanes sp. KI2]|uniref:DsbA family protein n=1 Tax=Actinoplanes sp. KI2 TaxID=2983315 RepID=UPI0021D59AF9|nr:DsbA family protein [Actinoplanes sp. KI2]MCU7727078.1 DsbA family protein [Actinoplanes sp. KI2]
MTSPLSTAGGRLAVPVGDRDHVLGPEDAPVTLVEYGDFQCPYCARAHLIMQELLRRRTNQVRFAYRHFPLINIHPYAEPAAEAAEAAGARGRFWPVHDWLFANQDRLSPATLIAALTDLGLDGRSIAAEVQDHAFLDKVQSDFVSGIRSGVEGTPTFFINGMLYTGGHSLPELVTAVDGAARAPDTSSAAEGRLAATPAGARPSPDTDTKERSS